MSIMNVALSGLRAASGDLEVTGNNIANANTTGFKQSSAQFADVFGGGSTGNQIGNGVKIASISQDFSGGPVNATNGQLDMAITGDGFFTMKSADGTTVYSRAGNFSVDTKGYIVNNDGSLLQGYVASNGQVGAAKGEIQIPTEPAPPKATANITFARNLDASSNVITATFDPADGSTYNASDPATIYDSLGGAHSMTTYYTKTADNNWAVNVEVDGTSLGSGSLAFNPDGSLLSATGLGSFTWNPGGGAQASQALSLNYTDATQFGGNSAPPSISQDGYAAGIFTGLDIDDNGVISARYTNGRLEPLGQVAVATFANPQGLYSVGDMTWVETGVSGAAQSSKSNSMGSIRSGALEASNVDLTEQLVNMITAQRAFQANAQSIKAGDTLMQSIMSIQ